MLFLQLPDSHNFVPKLKKLMNLEISNASYVNYWLDLLLQNYVKVILQQHHL